MIKNIVALFCLLLSLNSYGQNIKAGVAVVGSTPAAVAAAIQSAHSGVKTVLIDAGSLNSISFSVSDQSIKAGVYADFIKRVDSLQKTPFKDSQTLTPTFIAQVFKSWTDTIKNLTVLRNSTIKELERSGKGWEIDLPGREIKADVIVDGTIDRSVLKMALQELERTLAAPAKESDNQYRTIVATTGNTKFKHVPLAQLLIPEVENLVVAGPLGQANMHTGQAAGATAAYCAFFKTTTKNLNARAIQSELLTFKSILLKYDDIADNDSSMVAFQHIGVTGILKGKEENGKFLFMPEGVVNTEELRLPLKEYYSRSHIWFLDNKEEKLTLESALSLIKFLASRGEELSREVEKAWKTSLRQKSAFDLKRPVTRRELAILLDTYLQPFVVAVDTEGNVKR